MAEELFISYSRRDRDRIVSWIERLQAAGVSVWIDEAGIEGGMLWGKEIVEAIDASRVMIVMLSQVSVASPQVVREVSLALDGDKRLLPLLLEPVTVPADLRYALAGIEYIELFAVEPEQQLRAVLRALIALGITVTNPDILTQAAASEPQSAPNNLPRQLTRFIGRENEMAEVKRLLSDASLLTLVGPGGCGKTRLALQVAGDQGPQFADGVWLVELAALSESDLIPQAVASALEVREEVARPLVQTLTEFLRPKTLLLVLDNCEHLVANAARLAETLLRGSSELRILATSREALGVSGEVAWPVPSLSLPDLGSLPDLHNLAQYEAASLFLDRALLSRPAFQLTQQNAPAVAQICCQLDGLPLAIELAAARVTALSVEQIASRLEDRFRLLTDGSRTVMPRHQTLRATIDWSYDLLSEAEKALFRRLSVFAGGWTLEAAETVGTGDGIDRCDILDLLGQLLDKSLVMLNEDGVETRYRLLSSIRHYGAERMRGTPEDPAARDRHLDHYLALAEQAESELSGTNQAIWLNRLETDHDNFRAALGWAAERGKAEAGLRLGAALWRFWHVRGHLREGRDRLAMTLSLPGAAASAAARARALNGAGALAHDQGSYAEAEAILQESLTLARQCGDKETVASALNNLGSVALDRGDDDQAASFYREALALWRELGNMRGIAILLNNLGSLARDRANPEEAEGYLKQSLALQRQLGNQRGIASALINLADIAMAQGRCEEAGVLLEESRRGYQALGDSFGIAVALQAQANLSARLGNLEEAAEFYRECLPLCAKLEHRAAVAGGLEGLAGVIAAQGDPLRAARLFGAAEALREAASSPLPDYDRADYDRAVVAARSAAEANAWTAAWAAGRTMSMEEALAAAR